MAKFGFGEEVVNKLKIKSVLGHVLLSPEGFQQKLLGFRFLFRSGHIVSGSDGIKRGKSGSRQINKKALIIIQMKMVRASN